MFIFVLNILCHNLSGTPYRFGIDQRVGYELIESGSGTKRLSLGTKHPCMGTKRLDTKVKAKKTLNI